jgi:hypothetical protein
LTGQRDKPLIHEAHIVEPAEHIPKPRPIDGPEAPANGWFAQSSRFRLLEHDHPIQAAH